MRRYQEWTYTIYGERGVILCLCVNRLSPCEDAQTFPVCTERRIKGCLVPPGFMGSVPSLIRTCVHEAGESELRCRVTGRRSALKTEVHT